MRRVTGYKDYTTREGDTFDALALEMYGEEMLAHYIVEFNPDYADLRRERGSPAADRRRCRDAGNSAAVASGL